MNHDPSNEPLGLKAQMETGRPVLGMILRAVRSPEIARIAKASGHDFLFIDTQHSAFGLETIEQIAFAAKGCDIATLVRVTAPDDPNIGRLLDCGVTGIIVPDIETAAQAAEVVQQAKFAPLGKRSVVGGGAFFDYSSLPLSEAIEILNRQTLVICMIESTAGLDAVEQIAGVAGVDVLHVGCNDLLVDLGKPGDFASVEIQAAVQRVIDVCERHQKFAGYGGDRDASRQAAVISSGARFLTTQSDVNYLLAAASAKTAELRALMSGAP